MEINTNGIKFTHAQLTKGTTPQSLAELVKTFSEAGCVKLINRACRSELSHRVAQVKRNELLKLGAAAQAKAAENPELAEELGIGVRA